MTVSQTLLRRVLCITIFAFAAGATRAHATPITLTASYDPPDVTMDSGPSCTSSTIGTKCSSLSFVLTLAGFNATTDTLTSAAFTASFYDNNDGGAETASITMDGLSSGTTTITNKSTAAAPFVFNYNVLMQVNTDGTLNVVFTRQSGNFYFASATLTAIGDRSDPAPIPVPEPASALLLAAGLGAGVLSKRLKR